MRSVNIAGAHVASRRYTAYVYYHKNLCLSIYAWPNEKYHEIFIKHYCWITLYSHTAVNSADATRRYVHSHLPCCVYQGIP